MGAGKDIAIRVCFDVWSTEHLGQPGFHVMIEEPPYRVFLLGTTDELSCIERGVARARVRCGLISAEFWVVLGPRVKLIAFRTANEGPCLRMDI
jgi:hypothetical protein